MARKPFIFPAPGRVFLSCGLARGATLIVGRRRRRDLCRVCGGRCSRFVRGIRCDVCRLMVARGIARFCAIYDRVREIRKLQRRAS